MLILVQNIENQYNTSLKNFKKNIFLKKNNVNLAERIFELIEIEKNQSAFLKKVGWETAEISALRENPQRSIGYKKLKSLLDAYPQVSSEWLMRGEGERYRVVEGPVNLQIGNRNNNRQNVTEVSNIELLQQTIAAQAKTIALLEQRLDELSKR